jgi:hypothetical protein
MLPHTSGFGIFELDRALRRNSDTIYRLEVGLEHETLFWDWTEETIGSITVAHRYDTTKHQ